MQMERIARILSHLAFPVCQCVSSPPGVPWSFLRPDPPAPPCSFPAFFPHCQPSLLASSLPVVCLSACLGIECIAFNIYLLLFSLFTRCRAHFSFFPFQLAKDEEEQRTLLPPSGVRGKLKMQLRLKLHDKRASRSQKVLPKGVCMFSAHEYPLPSSINSCIHNGETAPVIHMYVCMYIAIDGESLFHLIHFL